MNMYDVAKAIAAHIPGATATHCFDRDGNKIDNRAMLLIEGGGSILLVSSYLETGKALVHIDTRDLDVGTAPDMPRCGFNPSADPKRIAGNIARKLLPTIPTLLERVESIRTAQAERRASVASAADALRLRFPSLSVETGDYESRFYNSSPSFSGRIASNGNLYFNHLYVDADKAQAVLSALMGV